MHPILVELHGFGLTRAIPSYGVLIVCGVTVGIVIAVGRARSYRLDRFDVLAVGLLGFGGGMVGSTGLYLVIHARELWNHPSLLVAPGHVFYGGLAGGALACFLYCRAYQISLGAAADVAAPGLALGHAIGRLGCLMAGCCYGRVVSASFPLAITLDGAPRHPVQLYEAAGLVVIALALLALSRRLRPRPGALFVAYLAGYALLRLATEHFRGDNFERGFLFSGGPSTSQALALVTLALSAFFLTRLPHQKGAS
ncbi:MAG TPA: prolipoprotein diacylglyceryl transferase [Polyangia bacterium]